MILAAPQSTAVRRVVIVFALIACAGLAVVLFLFNPTEHAFYPICVFHRLTGLECPGCGGTRALYSLAHGQVLAALHFNALVVLAVPFVAVGGVRMLLREAAGLPPRPFVVSAGWSKFLVIVVIAFTVLRNVPCSPFTYLSPETISGSVHD